MVLTTLLQTQAGEDDNIVSSLLNTGEYPGNSSQAQQEAGDGRQLTCMTITEVGNNLDYFTKNDHWDV